MRSCCALYIDAGYLLAAAATRVAGTSLRGGVKVHPAPLVQSLVEQVEADSGLPLLRVNWYDSGGRPGGQPDPQQVEIGMLPRVKLRLGRRSMSGEQKGVDLRLGLDLVTHARNRIVDVVYLLSGDDDLTEAVEEAQGHGVQVFLLAVPDAHGVAHAVARHLEREADGLILVGGDVIDTTVSRIIHVPPIDGPSAAEIAEAVRAAGDAGDAEGAPVPGPPKPKPGPPPALSGTHVAPPPRPSLDEMPRPEPMYSTTTGAPLPPVDDEVAGPDIDAQMEKIDEVCRSVFGGWARSAGDDERSRLLAGRPSIPSDIDRALLLDLSARAGVYEIDEAVRLVLRRHFWQVAESVVGE